MHKKDENSRIPSEADSTRVLRHCAASSDCFRQQDEGPVSNCADSTVEFN